MCTSDSPPHPGRSAGEKERDGDKRPMHGPAELIFVTVNYAKCESAGPALARGWKGESGKENCRKKSGTSHSERFLPLPRPRSPSRTRACSPRDLGVVNLAYSLSRGGRVQSAPKETLF